MVTRGKYAHIPLSPERQHPAMKVGLSGQSRERNEEVKDYGSSSGSDFPPVQKWNTAEPPALDSRVTSPIFWSVVQITKGTRPQKQPRRLPEAAACHLGHYCL